MSEPSEITGFPDPHLATKAVGIPATPRSTLKPFCSSRPVRYFDVSTSCMPSSPKEKTWSTISWIIFAFASISFAASALSASSFGVLGYLYLMESAALPPPRCAKTGNGGTRARAKKARATAIRVMEARVDGRGEANVELPGAPLGRRSGHSTYAQPPGRAVFRAVRDEPMRLVHPSPSLGAAHM